MGNNDARGYALPLGSESRKTFPTVTKRTQNGKTSVLLFRNIHANERVLELSTRREADILGIGSKFGYRIGANGKRGNV